MSNKAKTYNQFINEAHVDKYGELYDFTPPSDNDPEIRIIDEIEKITDFINNEGAEIQSTLYNDGIVKIGFEYFGAEYLMILDLDTNSAEVRAFTRRGERIEVYTGSMDELFDVLAQNGLSFLR